MSAEAGALLGNGPTIRVMPGDGLWHYVFDEPGGDCPAGCTPHAYTHYTVTSDGALELIGTSDGSAPVPDWVTEYASMDACH